MVIVLVMVMMLVNVMMVAAVVVEVVVNIYLFFYLQNVDSRKEFQDIGMEELFKSACFNRNGGH